MKVYSDNEADVKNVIFLVSFSLSLFTGSSGLVYGQERSEGTAADWYASGQSVQTGRSSRLSICPVFAHAVGRHVAPATI